MIPYSRQTITDQDIRAVVKALKSDWLTQGPAVEEFERALAKYVGVRFAVAFSSGTAALQAAYFAAGLGRGDEIITSPLTFAATTNAALWQGARPVFADIEAESGNIDPEEILEKITKRTKAIVAVDYAGLPVKLDGLKKVARKHKLFLIEDAAHALGAMYRGKKIGSISDMVMFSFHPVKSITTGEGGAIVTNHKHFHERLLIFRNQGITKDKRLLQHPSPGYWYYEMHELGINGRLTDIQAALGRVQLKKIGKFIKARRALAVRYGKMLGGLPYLKLPREFPGTKSSWHLYPVRLVGKLAGKRTEVFNKLREEGIGVQVHYIPVYLHPYYQKLGYRKGLCPKAEAFYESVFSLPLFPNLRLSEQKKVVDILKKILGEI